MGDRCYVTLVCRVQDKDKLLEVLGGGTPDTENVSDDGKTVTLGISDCNYALYDEMGEAAKKGLYFHGDHTAGGVYPAGMFVAYRREYLVVDALNTDNCYPVVAVLSDGKVYRRALDDVRTYYRRLRAVKKWMNHGS